jgi:hypothetical protein
MPPGTRSPKTPEMWPFSTPLSNRALNASATRLNNRGERGSPCLRPQKVLKKLLLSPFEIEMCSMRLVEEFVM